MNALYKNNAILKPYQGVISDTVHGLKMILKDRLLSVYGCGSWIRNETSIGSDIDFFFIVNSFISKDEKEAIQKLQENIRLLWSGHGFVDIDIRFVNKKDEDNFFTIAHKEIIQVDGFLLYGVKYDWDIYKDYSIVQIAQAFNKIAFYIYTNLLSLDDTDTRLKNRSRRSLAKTVIRTLEWNAVLNGAPISHSINDYTDHIKKYVPQFLPTMKKAMNIYKKKIIIDTDVTFLEEILKANLAQLKK